MIRVGERKMIISTARRASPDKLLSLSIQDDSESVLELRESVQMTIY